MQTTIIIAAFIVALPLLRLSMAVHLLAQTQINEVKQKTVDYRNLKLVPPIAKEN